MNSVMLRDSELVSTQDAEVFETYFGGDVKVDGVIDDPWTISHVGDVLSFQAPAGAAMKWFTLYNFELETDVAPDERSEVTLGVMMLGTPSELNVGLLAPGDPA